MNPSPLYITRDDHHRLRQLLSAVPRSLVFETLRGELDRATVLDPAAVPSDVVTMGATVRFEDLGTGELEEYTLTFPDQADIGEGRLSILTPIGTALLGFRAGAIVDWPTPGGIRHLKIHRVTPRSTILPPAAALTASR